MIRDKLTELKEEIEQDKKQAYRDQLYYIGLKDSLEAACAYVNGQVDKGELHPDVQIVTETVISLLRMFSEKEKTIIIDGNHPLK